MYSVRHHLSNDFPEFKTRIEYLKNSDAEFIRLLNQYHATDEKISGREKSINSSEGVEPLKRWRVQLKDRLYAILKSCENSRQHKGMSSSRMVGGAV
ncbi:MAG: DUF465 domain-containing protein [Gammaproteobacteria bacterium]|nr:DUF465 domain-containing protein [Gammaproteobacteria bacterium]